LKKLQEVDPVNAWLYENMLGRQLKQ